MVRQGCVGIVFNIGISDNILSLQKTKIEKFTSVIQVKYENTSKILRLSLIDRGAFVVCVIEGHRVY